MKFCRQCQRSYPNSFAVCPTDGTRLSEQGEWSAGTLIRGKYRIIEKLGQGAMGAVYKAMHVRFNELRALKVMAPELANDKTFLKRFEHEAILARKLHHPNAVHVEDIDETEDGQPFIVMEYIAGRSLSNLLKTEGALPAQRVSTLAKQIASALDAAQQLGIVHRDIKPDNIVLIQSPAGETAKVLDFGIAKMKEGIGATSPGMTLTQTGMVVGTPFYMSPEQAKGIPGDQLDGRSDLYSLGIVMYQMLTGQLPLKGDTPIQVLMAHIETPPPPISRVRPDLHVPESVEELVMKCLAKDPQHRPQSGHALIADLDAWESDSTKLYSESGIAADRPSSHAKQQARADETSDSITVATPPPFTGTPAQSTPTAAPSVPPPSPLPPSRPPVTPHSDSIFVSSVSRPPQEPPSLASSTLHVADSPRSSSAKKLILAAVASLLVIIGGVLWYTSTSGPFSTNETHSSTPKSTTPAPFDSTVDPQNQPPPFESAPNPTPPEGTGTNPASAASSPPSRPAKTTPKLPSQPPRETAADAAARAKKVAAALTLGDLFYEKGEYDNAIKEYTQGLQADPSNTKLKDRIQRALRAKAAEQSVNPFPGFAL